MATNRINTKLRPDAHPGYRKYDPILPTIPLRMNGILIVLVVKSGCSMREIMHMGIENIPMNQGAALLKSGSLKKKIIVMIVNTPRQINLLGVARFSAMGAMLPAAKSRASQQMYIVPMRSKLYIEKEYSAWNEQSDVRS